LSIEEEELYYQLVKNVLTRPDTVALFKTSFDTTYSKYITPIPRKIRIETMESGMDLEEVSVLESKRFLESKERHFPLFIPGRLGGLEFPKKMDPWFYELAIAFHSRHPTFGVRSMRPPEKEDASKGLGVVIDLEKFSLYRQPYTVLYHDKNMSEVKEILYEEFADLMYVGGPPIFREQVARFMPDVDVDNLIYMSVNALKARCINVSTCEHMRQVRGKPEKLAYKPLLKLQLESPVLTDYHNQTIKVEAIRRYNRMYFKPSWEPHFSIKDVLSGPKEKKYKEWYRPPHTDDTYFTYDFLLENTNSPLGSSKQLRAWWEQFVSLSQARFKTLIASAALGKRVRFSREEDALIIKYVRPGMSKRAKELLVARCSRRTWLQLTQRATTLRKKLIKDGETDINKIPHINYSVELLRQLEDNK